ncbi:alpha/beta hydrolase-fold protein [Bacillus safensis]|uniref:alpha/beta hydrolase n=1 Tax=Bacillus safensis TaxID=561879 RepID=UPI002236F001|nr:alpha/beta hydrolase-fold protein [Bacillus safensis]MCW4643658.1 alpha/beta hydrolase-fold protein [Bacillus safensis]MCY7566324.1 alpha/beta hydrolase [Bacillus safensis]MCY7624547.1 alpha/beta hydrolase [Bacillus safensis]MCY7631686.1 alpha/beta hydrolase [Bacillus safensis]MCY7647891.1 alpha/beta hydrolase [Bacillus safensis]
MKGTLLYDELSGRQLDIYLPPHPTTLIPAVIVQDGSSLFHQHILSLEKMIECGTILPVVLIGVHPFNRLDEYTPWEAPALHSSFPAFKGEADTYLTFLIEQLMPYLVQHYPIQPDHGQHALIGASLGGLVSMYALWKELSLFQHVGSLSGSFWYPHFMPYVREHNLLAVPQRIYLSVGSEEGKGKSSAQQYMVPFTKELHHILHDSGISENHLHLHIEQGEGHHISQFQLNFVSALKWFYGVK